MNYSKNFNIKKILSGAQCLKNTPLKSFSVKKDRHL